MANSQLKVCCYYSNSSFAREPTREKERNKEIYNGCTFLGDCMWGWLRVARESWWISNMLGQMRRPTVVCHSYSDGFSLGFSFIAFLCLLLFFSQPLFYSTSSALLYILSNFIILFSFFHDSPLSPLLLFLSLFLILRILVFNFLPYL